MRLQIKKRNFAQLFSVGSGPVALKGLVVLVVACFLFGGAARGDVQSLVLLRPLAFLMCVVGAFTISRDHLRRFRAEFVILAITVFLLTIHLIPLPPSVWQALPGREFIIAIDTASGLGEVWRPLTLTPPAAWNALLALSIPAACLLLGAQLSIEHSRVLLRVLIVTGVLSAIWGILQIVGANGLYTYNVRTEGMPVGMFANRNHNALLLALIIPMLAVWASGQSKNEASWRVRVALAITGALLLVPVILATGSRAGLVFLAMAVISTPFLFHNSKPLQRRRGKSVGKAFFGGAAFVAFGLMTVVAVIALRSDSVQRLIDGDRASEVRFLVWGPLIEIGMKYLPFGSGSGSFVESYQVDEPRELLGPFYLNHAHNEYIEIFVTLGIPGVLLLLAGFIWLASAARKALAAGSRSEKARYLRLGVVVFLVMAVGSLVDYPLRTPYCLALLSIAAIWVRLGICQNAPHATKHD